VIANSTRLLAAAQLSPRMAVSAWMDLHVAAEQPEESHEHVTCGAWRRGRQADLSSALAP